jgi:hypothetical protein
MNVGVFLDLLLESEGMVVGSDGGRFEGGRVDRLCGCSEEGVFEDGF